MTDRAEIECLLNQAGRTLEGLPTQDDYWHSDDYVDRNSEIGMMMYRSGFKRNEPYIMHQSDVIELLVGALRDALDKQPRWAGVKERLPDVQESVLFCHMIGKDVRSVRTGYRSAFTPGRFYTTSGMGTDTVTHWMPLPQPPEEDE